MSCVTNILGSKLGNYYSNSFKTVDSLEGLIYGSLPEILSLQSLLKKRSILSFSCSRTWLFRLSQVLDPAQIL